MRLIEIAMALAAGVTAASNQEQAVKKVKCTTPEVTHVQRTDAEHYDVKLEVHCVVRN